MNLYELQHQRIVTKDMVSKEVQFVARRNPGTRLGQLASVEPGLYPRLAEIDCRAPGRSGVSIVRCQVKAPRGYTLLIAYVGGHPYWTLVGYLVFPSSVLGGGLLLMTGGEMSSSQFGILYSRTIDSPWRYVASGSWDHGTHSGGIELSKEYRGISVDEPSFPKSELRPESLDSPNPSNGSEQTPGEPALAILEKITELESGLAELKNMVANCTFTRG